MKRSKKPSNENLPPGLKNIRGVILDLDGTLYNQKRLRIWMALDLFCRYLFSPWRLKDVLILFHFRRIRESLAEAGEGDVSKQQLLLTAGKCNCSVQQVETVVEEWMYRRPLQNLPSCRYSFVDTLLSWVEEQQIMVAVLSDYPTKGKLEALRLTDVISYSSVDPNINSLKPDPAGLLYICQTWNLLPGECLVIGDRDERDGEAARRAGMHYVIVPKGLKISGMNQLFQDIQFVVNS